MGTRALITKNGKPFIATHWDGNPASLGIDLINAKSDADIIRVANKHTIDSAQSSILKFVNKGKFKHIAGLTKGKYSAKDVEDLSEDEEKEVYTRWNSGTKQNTNDYVKLYWDDIPLAVWFDKERSLACRVSHAWGKGVVEFKTLLSAYLTRDEQPFRGAFRGSAPDFVEECIALGSEDAKIIKAFLADFVAIFGVPDKENIHWKQSNFYPLMRIWLDNYRRTNIEHIKKAFVRVRSCPTVVFYSKYSGSMEVTIKNHDELLRIINGHRTKNPLI